MSLIAISVPGVPSIFIVISFVPAGNTYVRLKKREFIALLGLCIISVFSLTVTLHVVLRTHVCGIMQTIGSKLDLSFPIWSILKLYVSFPVSFIILTVSSTFGFFDGF